MRTITAVLLGFFCAPLLAQEGMFAGLGLGSFRFDEARGDPFFGDRSDTVSSYKIFGGFEFNDYVFAEIGYGRTQDLQSSASGTDPFFGDFAGSVQTEFTTTTLRAVGQFARDWGVLMGGLGYFDTDADLTLNLVTDLASFTSEGTTSDDGMTAMLGIEWRFGRFGTGYGVRLEYEWWDFEEADASSINLGVSYRF